MLKICCSEDPTKGHECDKNTLSIIFWKSDFVFGDECVNWNGRELCEPVAENDACDADGKPKECHFCFVLISIDCWIGYQFNV